MSDSFAAATTRTPTEVRKVVITMAVTGGDPSNGYVGGYYFEVLDSAGEPMGVRQGNLVPHLTATQRTNLMAFLDSLLTKAQGTVE